MTTEEYWKWIHDNVQQALSKCKATRACNTQNCKWAASGMACVLVHKKIRAYRSIFAYVGSSMQSVSIHTLATVCYGSLVQWQCGSLQNFQRWFDSITSRQVMGCWYSWEHSGFASLSPRFEPGTVHQIGEREALVTSGDCKSSTLRYTGFESLALHQITVDTTLC